MLTKPYEPRQLLEVVEHWIRRSKAEPG
jgi:DNA-binding response OmpR family regulator